MRYLTLVPMIACGLAESPPEGVSTFEALPIDQAAPPLEVALSPMVPGLRFNATVAGLPSGSEVGFRVGPKYEPGACATTLFGVCLDIGRPSARAITRSRSGRATLSMLVPAALPKGSEVFLQLAGRTPAGVSGVTTTYRFLLGCGDGVLDADELCDDGNILDDDGCTAVCLCADTDTDTVCDSVDICEGDDALGDIDGDGVCGGVVPGDLGTLRLISAGTFTMGCIVGRDDVEGGCNSDELPHDVTLSRSFWMMEAEVTQEQYAALMGSNPSHFQGSDLPVENVSWYDAVAFADAVSIANGLTPCGTGNPYACDGWRLPTEAEWEYAARGGEGFPFAGANNVDEVAWYSGNAGNTTHSVCSKLRNGFGLCDMSGNVREFNADWYGSYVAAASLNPSGPANGASRLSRGGTWASVAEYERIAYRGKIAPDSKNFTTGFRLVRGVGLCPGEGDAVDTDGDGIVDPCDACPLDASPDDDDHDRVCDSDDVCAGDDTLGDVDGDGVCGGAPPRDIGAPLLIPSGTFTMGCIVGRDDVEGGCNSDELPHDVTLSRSFWMMEAEVTQEQYAALMGSNPSHFQGSDLPVENVSWYDAVAFADAVSIANGLTPCGTGNPYACDGWRLPTEAEWEYAARGGEGFPFAGANNVDEVAWYSGNAGNTTHSVCSKLRNGFGLCDMSGNVREFNADWYGSYVAAASLNPSGPANGASRLSRGGTWASVAEYERIAYRGTIAPDSKNFTTGFRLVRADP